MDRSAQWEGEGGWWAPDALAAIEPERPEREGIQMLELLADKGWDCSDPVGERGETLMMLAAQGGRLGIVEWLAEKGADPERVNLYGKGALCYAASCGLDAAVLALDAISGPDDGQAEIALMMAVEAGSLGASAFGSLARRSAPEALARALEALGALGEERGGAPWRAIYAEWAQREAKSIAAAALEGAGVGAAGALRV